MPVKGGHGGTLADALVNSYIQRPCTCLWSCCFTMLLLRDPLRYAWDDDAHRDRQLLDGLGSRCDPEMEGLGPGAGQSGSQSVGRRSVMSEVDEMKGAKCKRLKLSKVGAPVRLEATAKVTWFLCHTGLQSVCPLNRPCHCYGSSSRAAWSEAGSCRKNAVSVCSISGANPTDCRRALSSLMSDSLRST